MFEHLLLPLNKHVDDGFGAIARSFKETADYLVKCNMDKITRCGHSHLPINYLYRHAIELFLKSMIIVPHRSLRLTLEPGNYEPVPKIKINNGTKPVSLFSVHGIQALFDEMKRIFETNHDSIGKIAKTDWSIIPEELGKWIAVVNQIDPDSAVFRYPVSRSLKSDAEKSSFKPIEMGDLLSRMQADGPKQMAFLVVDDNNDIVESFALDHEPMPGLREALVGAAELLSRAQLGIMAELGEAASD
jgi:hypothetical protein